MKILITGMDSYVGISFERYMKNFEKFHINTLDMKCVEWKEHDFSKYDCIFHVAGIAHNNSNKKDTKLYYQVNRDLAIETAIKAKADGVKQFIFMSSMSIYNGCKVNKIFSNTIPKTKDCYGDSKLQADLKLQKMATSNFKIAIVRPPIIFGSNCKGNFPKLDNLVKKLFFFPNVKNQRSMLFIDNLCEFLRLLMFSGEGGIYFPQNEDYFSTTEIIRILSKEYGKKIWFTRLGNILIYILKPFVRNINKLFGDLTYDEELSKHFNNKYCIVNNKDSIIKSTSKDKNY